MLKTAAMRLSAIVIALIFFLPLISHAQKTISGVVKDGSGPVAGATVLVKGTNLATQSGIDGHFTISVPQNRSTLVVSFVNYETQEIKLSEDQKSVDVTLVLSTNTLDEVVITGYTAQKKKELTGAVAVINANELKKVSSPSFGGQLQGRASGVITNSSGVPGTGVAIRIRGNSTFTEGGGDPLIIVDGVQIRGAFQNQINPNDIESIQVLKDAATTAAYGIGANNGVIIITTKKGKAGAPRVELSSYYGLQSPGGKTYDKQMIKTAAEYADLVFQAYSNAGQWPQAPNSQIGRTYGVGATPVIPQYINPLPAPNYGDPINTTYSYPDNLVMRASPGTNWWKAVFRDDAPITEHNVSVSGGSGNGGRYFFSANYFSQDGIMRYTDYNRYSIRGNTEFKVKGFTFGENMTVAFDNYVGQPNGNQVEQNTITEGILKMQPIIPVYDEGGNWGGTKAGFGNGKNGLAKVYRNKDNRGEGMRFLGNVYGEVKVLNHITGRVMFGVDHGWNFGKAYNFADVESNEVSGSGFSEFVNRYFNWIFQQQLTYNNNFGDHDVKVTAVHEAKLNKYRNVSAGLSGYQIEQQSLWYVNAAFGDPASRSVNTSGGTNNAKESYLGRVEYGYKGKFLVNGTARYDQSSNFADTKGQLFGGAGVAWNLSDESFMQNVTWTNNVKLRVNYGVTGNDAIPAASNYSLYGAGVGNTFYDINGTNTSAVTGYAATSAGIPVVWEKQKQFDVGIDATLFRNRLSLTIDYYKRTNKDFLFQPDQPATAGLYGTAVTPPYVNLGSISNKGIEANLGWKDQFSRDFRYNVDVNLTFNKNRIDELAPQYGITSFFPAIPESRIGALVRNYQGHPMSTFYGYTVAGIFQDANDVNNSPTQDGAAVGRFKWKDINGDKVIDNNDKGIIGDPNAKLYYGFNLGIEFKNFDLTAFFQGAAGLEIMNYSKYFTDFWGFFGNRSERMLYQSWRPDRTNAILPKLDPYDTYSPVPSSYYVENGSFLRAKVIQIGYSLPESLMQKARIDKARIYIQGQNLFTITKYLGLDPTLGTRNNATEQWTNIDYGNYPTARVIMVGLNLSF